MFADISSRVTIEDHGVIGIEFDEQVIGDERVVAMKNINSKLSCACVRCDRERNRTAVCRDGVCAGKDLRGGSVVFGDNAVHFRFAECIERANMSVVRNYVSYFLCKVVLSEKIDQMRASLMAGVTCMTSLVRCRQEVVAVSVDCIEVAAHGVVRSIGHDP